MRARLRPRTVTNGDNILPYPDEFSPDKSVPQWTIKSILNVFFAFGRYSEQVGLIFLTTCSSQRAVAAIWRTRYVCDKIRDLRVVYRDPFKVYVTI